MSTKKVQIGTKPTNKPAPAAADAWVESRSNGDEPEPMRVDKVNLRELSSLVLNPQFSEGRALAALYLARDLLTQRGVFQP